MTYIIAVLAVVVGLAGFFVSDSLAVTLFALFFVLFGVLTVIGADTAPTGRTSKLPRVESEE